ncbi:MAG: hypothetical protein ACXADY_02865 [Candidatus Hodarchaeales archaeon]|jgi:SMC interacting uncharacterized protein involved in chromosome segregation
MVKVSSKKKEDTLVISQDEDTSNQTSIDYPTLIKELVDRIKELENELIQLTKDYHMAVDRNSEELRSLNKSIQKLENKLDRINKARSISPRIPEILVFDD